MEKTAPSPFEYAMCTDEKVFVYNSENHVDHACHPDQLGGGTDYVLNDLKSGNPTLYAAGCAVGRVFCVVNSRWEKPVPASLEHLRIFTGTAFYVSPNIICTSRHVVDVADYRVLSVYFTPKWRFLSSAVEDLLYTLSFPLNLNASRLDKFNQEVAKRELYFVDKIFPLTPEHAEKFAHYRNPDAMPSNPQDRYYRTLAWQTANDFAFLHVTRPSAKWLVPSAITPELAYTCLIAYASKPKVQKEIKLNGEEGPRVTSLAKVFGNFDVRFFAPGITCAPRTTNSEGDLRLISNKCSCEAASSGGPIIQLSEKADYSSPTFIATQIGGYSFMGFSVSTPSTSRTFCMEWATHVLEDIQNANLKNNDPRISQVIAYAKLVRDKWPSGYQHTAIERVNALLAQLV